MAPLLACGLPSVSSGGQTLAQLTGYGIAGLSQFASGVRVHFIDNLDPATYAALLAKLPHLAAWSAARREKAARYTEAFAGHHAERDAAAYRKSSPVGGLFRRRARL